MESSYTLQSRKHTSAGASLIEFVLVLPVLLLVVGGMVDWAFGFYSAQCMQQAAEEGTKVASVVSSLTVNDTRVTTIVTDYIDNCGTVASNNIAGVSVATASNLSGEAVADDGGTLCDNEVEVRVTGTHNYLFLGIIGLPSLSLTRSHSVRELRNNVVCD